MLFNSGIPSTLHSERSFFALQVLVTEGTGLVGFGVNAIQNPKIVRNFEPQCPKQPILNHLKA